MGKLGQVTAQETRFFAKIHKHLLECYVWCGYTHDGQEVLCYRLHPNIFCQGVRMWGRMVKLAETMWEASQNQFLEKSA